MNDDTLIFFGVEPHGKLIARASGCGYDPEVNYCISRTTSDQRLLGGVIYTNYTGRTVQIHQAGFAPAWASTRMIYSCFHFPFDMMKVEKLIATVPSTNLRAVKITQKMGFVPVTTIPEIVPGGDMYIFSMSRHECKYLNLGWRYAVLENAA